VVEQATLTAAARTAPPPPPEGEPPSISPAAAAQLLPSPGLALVPLAPGSAAPSPFAPHPAGTPLLGTAPSRASSGPAAAGSFHRRSDGVAAGDGQLEGPRPPSDLSPPPPPRAAAAPLHFKSPPGVGDVRSPPPAAGDGTLFLPSSWQWAGATGGGGGDGAGNSPGTVRGPAQPDIDRRLSAGAGLGYLGDRGSLRMSPTADWVSPQRAVGAGPPPQPPPPPPAGYYPYEDVVSFAGLAAAVEFGYDIMTAGRT
jgi:hypothetical protein